jgi:hypothetical protein
LAEVETVPLAEAIAAAVGAGPPMRGYV